jgi:RNA polymerase sigma-70 factor, ECF subfamily
MDRAATSTPIANGDTAADANDFNSIVRHYRPKVFRFALASLRDKDAADEVTQDCFLKAYRAWDTFRRDCSMDTWLMRIVVNLVRDRARNRRLQFWKRTQMLAMPAETAGRWFAGSERSPEAQALLKEQVKAVWDAAAALPERQRTVFLLRFVEDMDILDIAAATGLKEGTVKAHLFRALQAVRERMGAQR